MDPLSIKQQKYYERLRDLKPLDWTKFIMSNPYVLKEWLVIQLQLIVNKNVSQV